MSQHAQRVASAVRAELARRKLSHSTLIPIIQGSRGAVYRRLAGEVPFNVDEIAQIAEFLDLPVSVLMGEPQVPA